MYLIFFIQIINIILIVCKSNQMIKKTHAFDQHHKQIKMWRKIISLFPIKKRTYTISIVKKILVKTFFFPCLSTTSLIILLVIGYCVSTNTTEISTIN